MDLFGLLWPDAAARGLVVSRPASRNAGDARYGAVAVVGAGGKTALLARVAREAAARGIGAFLAVTTKWRNPPGFSGVRHEIVTGAAESARFAADSEPPGIVLAASGPPTEDGTKVTGIDPDDLLRFVSARRVAAPRRASVPFGGAAPLGSQSLFALPVVIEADGARGRALKVPGPGEPVVPPWVTAVACVTGVAALGSEANEAIVHRTDAFARLAGEVAASITPTVVARLMEDPHGMFKGAPEPARRIWIVNGADTPAAVARASSFAELVLERFESGTDVRPLPVDTVVVASLQSNDPVRVVVMDRS